MTDEELALSYIDGNNRAFDLLLSRNQAKLFSYIVFVVHDRDLAEDIFQETFVKVITKLQQRKYTTSGKFGAWIMRIAHNVIMDWYREQKSDKIVEPTLENDLSNISDGDILDGNIENEYVNNQVMRSETTNVSINTALGRMRYAIINLRRMAKEYNVALQLD